MKHFIRIKSILVSVKTEKLSDSTSILKHFRIGRQRTVKSALNVNESKHPIL